jgi:xanthine dehydrogenase small subunit
VNSKNSIVFGLNDEIRRIDFSTEQACGVTTTLLEYLRLLPGHRGTKEGCAEGDCGACTVVIADIATDGRIRYRAVNSCLIFLPMLHGKLVMTIEHVARSRTELHPLQQALIDFYGSQCGFCTPGVVMSLYALWKNNVHPSRADIEEALSGNLCRCTGYQPILRGVEAAYASYDPLFEADEDRGRLGVLKDLSENSLELATAGQRYYRPATLNEALATRFSHPNALIVNGGTDIALRVTKKFETLAEILDISGVKELRGWSVEKGSLRLGGGMTINDLGETDTYSSAVGSDNFSTLHRFVRLFGSQQIRNLATIAGNISTASPIGDTIPLLIALRAVVEVQSVNGSRSIAVEDFITGYRTTARRSDELITAIHLPPVDKGEKIYWYKVSRRPDVDIAAVSGAFRITLDDDLRVVEVILAFGGMDARARRAKKAEAVLKDKTWSEENVRRAMQSVEAEFRPLSDVRGSAVFRILAAKNLLLKCWLASTAAEQVSA